MATPQWVRFSAVPIAIEQVLTEDLASIFSTFSCRLWVITELGLNKDKQVFGDIDGPFINCDDIGNALEISRTWRGVAMTFVVEAIWHNITLNLWHDQDSTNICLYIDSGIMWYEWGDHEQGEWLLEFVLQFTVALNADCCGYGRDPDYDFIYQPLDLGRVLSRLRDGSLLRIRLPVIHMISNKRISADEVKDLISKHGTYPGLQYRESIAGYHVLWNF